MEYCTSSRAPYLYDLAYQVIDIPAECRYLLDLARRSGAAAPERILDVGCGPGHHVRHLQGLGFEAHGIDQDRYMLQYAARLARDEETRLQLRRGDMRRFRVSRPYDLVLCLGASFNSLLTDADGIAALRSMRSALRPGGRLIVEVHEPSRVYDAEPTVEWTVPSREGTAACTFALMPTRKADRYRWDIVVDLHHHARRAVERARFRTQARPWSRKELTDVAAEVGLRLRRWDRPQKREYRTCVFVVLSHLD